MRSFKELATGYRVLNNDFKPILNFLLDNPVTYTKELVDETVIVTITNHGSTFPDNLDITPLTRLHSFNPVRVDDGTSSFDAFSFSFDALASRGSLEGVFYAWVINNLPKDSDGVKTSTVTIDGISSRTWGN